ncbi:MAG: hypothetical protein NTW49_11865 [Bacteroidia bacterium]|nr:hypothetical protein [Bacteroidia bacterium]
MKGYNLFKDFDFKRLDSHDFKEERVREVIILPVLYELGYNNFDISQTRKQEIQTIESCQSK